MSNLKKIFINIFEDPVKIFGRSLRIFQGSYKDPMTILKRSTFVKIFNDAVKILKGSFKDLNMILQVSCN